MDNNQGLVVDQLTVRFGGLVAVDDVTLHAPRGRISGLVGPNGAGKTTTFNACSGLLTPASGTISLFSEEVTRLGPSARAQRGLGRTFQRMELWDRMTVAENISVAREAHHAGKRLLGPLLQIRGERDDVRSRTEHAVGLCGLADVANVPAGSLSTGQRRLVELARAVAGGFDLLLLDEPSSGLDARETQHFGQILKHLVRESGVGILLVEHDMSLVRAVCDYVYVLDFGRLIDDGPTAEVLDSEAVRAAYLGSDAA